MWLMLLSVVRPRSKMDKRDSSTSSDMSFSRANCRENNARRNIKRPIVRQRLLLTLTVTFVSFVTLFTVYFSSLYSRCDLSTGIFYTNIWIWIWTSIVLL